MNSPLLLITADRDLAYALRKTFRGNLATTDDWPAAEGMPWDVLIVDVSGAQPSMWNHLERLSHQLVRPSIILLDDGLAPRERLARVSVEALVPLEECSTNMASRIEEHTSDHIFRAAAAQIRADSALPYPLVRFLAAAFTERCSRVNILARSLGTSQSTLRSQWRAVRSDPSLRLEDVVRHVTVLRERAARKEVDWRSDLHKLVRSISAGA